MQTDILKQKNTSLIIQVVKDKKVIRRSDVYKEVMERQKRIYGKKSTYQVVCRDVDRLLKEGILKVVDGGLRSQVLSLK